ncbi:MAG: CBS domain-containing protein [Candidatus Saccharimonas sp.]
MELVGILIVVLVGLVLLIVASFSPRPSDLSNFELKRRSKLGDEVAKSMLKDSDNLGGLVGLLRIIEALALIIIGATMVWCWSWLGLSLAIIIALGYQRLANTKAPRQLSQALYRRHQVWLNRVLLRHKLLRKFIGANGGVDKGASLGSKQELEHILERSTGVLTLDEQTLLKNGLYFSDKLVASCLIPLSKVKMIDEAALLGPVALDELHRTGHSQFPVLDKVSDKIVGIVDIRDQLSLSQKTSKTAGKLMSQQIYFVDVSETLRQALSKFLASGNDILIVVNDNGKTLGILTLSDVIEALVGAKL